MQPRTIVSFQSDFPVTCDDDGPAGEELATFLADSLRAQGFEVVGLGEREGWAWDVTCRLANVRIDCIIGVVDDGPLQWLVTTTPRLHLMDRLLGRKHVDEQSVFYKAVDRILKDDVRFRTVRWYFKADFDKDYGKTWAEAPLIDSESTA